MVEGSKSFQLEEEQEHDLRVGKDSGREADEQPLEIGVLLCCIYGIWR